MPVVRALVRLAHLSLQHARARSPARPHDEPRGEEHVVHAAVLRVVQLFHRPPHPPLNVGEEAGVAGMLVALDASAVDSLDLGLGAVLQHRDLQRDGGCRAAGEVDKYATHAGLPSRAGASVPSNRSGNGERH